MAGSIRYLVPRNGTYFTRMRVPADLQPLIGKGELMRSLGGDRRAALRKHGETVVEFQRQLDEARQLVAAAVETDAIPERSRPILSRTMEPGAAVYEYAVQADESARYEADFRESQRLVDWATRTRPAHSHMLNRVVRGLATDAEIGAVVGWAIDDLYGDTVQRGSPEWRIAAMSLAAGTLEANKHSAALDAGGGPLAPMPFASRSIAPNAPAKQSDELVSRILCEESHLTLTELLPHYQKSRNVSAATISSCGAYVRALHEVTAGPVPVYRITRDHMRALRRLLVASPVNVTQRFPGMTITQATEANTKRVKPYPVMSAITAGQWLGGVKTVLEWCARQDIIPDSPGASVVKHGDLASLVAKLAETSVVAIADVIRECSASRSDLVALLEQGETPIGISLQDIAPRLMPLVPGFAGVDPNDKPAHTETGDTIPLAEHLVKLFGLATGAIGWPPETAWQATPAEITAAYMGRVDLLAVIFGGSSEGEGSNDNSDPMSARLDEEGLAAIAHMGRAR